MVENVLHEDLSILAVLLLGGKREITHDMEELDKYGDDSKVIPVIKLGFLGFRAFGK
jgi:hypothetical protein